MADLGAEIIVSTAAATSASGYPMGDLARLSNGDTLLAWTSASDGAGTGVSGQLFDTEGAPIGSVFTVNSTIGGNQDEPFAVGLAGGGFVVGWEAADGGDGSGTLVRARVFNTDGSPAGPDFVADTTTTGNQGAPAIAALPDGGFVMAWQSADIQAGAIRARVFDADGTSAAADFAVNDTQGALVFPSYQGDIGPELVALAGDEFVVTWHSSPNTLAARVYHDDGTPAGDDFALATDFATSDIPTVTPLPSGGFISIWIGADGQVHAEMFDATGAATASSFQVNAHTETGNLQSVDEAMLPPSVIVLPDGRMLATWLSPTDSGHNIYARPLDADGTPVGTEFVVNDTWVGGTSNRAATELPDGRIMMSWQAGADIVSAVFNADLSGVTVTGTSGDDTITGSPFDDHLSGGDGNDILEPGTGNDRVDGGAGTDEVVLVGATKADFQIEYDAASNGYVFEDLQPGTPFGDKTLVDVENVDFQNRGGTDEVDSIASLLAAPKELGGTATLATLTQITPGSAAAAIAGHYVAVWTENPDSVNSAVHAQLLAADGSPLGSEFIVNSSPATQTFAPAVTSLADGDFVVVWGTADGSDGAGQALRARLFAPDGTAVGSDFVVDSTGAGDQTNASVTALANGDFFVTWYSTDGGDGSTNVIRGRFFDAAGAALGSDFVLSSASNTVSISPVAAALPNGNIVVAGDGVHLFDAQGNALGSGLGGGGVWNAIAALPDSGFAIFSATEVSNRFAPPTYQNRLDIYDAQGTLTHSSGFPGEVSNPAIAVLSDGQHIVVGGPSVSSQTDSALVAVFTTDGTPVSSLALDTTTFTTTSPIADVSSAALSLAAGPDDNFLGLLQTPPPYYSTGGVHLIEDAAFSFSVGPETADFSSVRSDYDVRTFLQDGALVTQVMQQGGDQSDGTDTLSGTQHLQFTDHTFTFAGGDLDHVSNVDGGRFDDVLIQDGGQVIYAKMVDGAFQGFGVATGVQGADWVAVGSGDVNPGPTGGAEVFMQQQSTGTIVDASLDSGTTIWGVIDSHLNADWVVRAVADVTGDASTDVVLQSASTGTIIYEGIVDGVSQGDTLVTNQLSSDWKVVGAGDITGDGAADIVVQQQSTGTTIYAVMADGQFQHWGLVAGSLSPEWQVKAVADVNGDGFADVIVQQDTTGTTLYAAMKDGAFDHWGVVAAGLTSDWVVKAVADVDNDGLPEVVFQDVHTGATAYVNVDGGGANTPTWGNVTSALTSDWHVF